MSAEHRTRYATYADAIADGWRRINRRTDIDISGVGPQGETMFGYRFRAPDGQESTTISLTDEPNTLGRNGCCAEMFRTAAGD